MIRHLVLLGVGPGHWRFLQALLKRRGADIAITLVTRQEHYFSRFAILQGVSCQQPMPDCGLPLEPMLRRVNVNWLEHSASAIDANAKVLLLDDGRELRFDWLSCEPEPLQDRALAETLLPGARANGLFTRPREAFAKLWPEVARLAGERPQRIAVVAGALGAPRVPWPDEQFAIEMAFAVRQAFAGSAVTLVTGGDVLAAGTSGALQARIQQALKRQGITVLVDRAISILPQEVTLNSGARLACDVPLLVLATQTAPFAAGSGLALVDSGLIAVDRAQRSVSHGHVFASQEGQARNARTLATSLQGVIAGKASAPSRAKQNAKSAERAESWSQMALIQCGNGRAIVSWRGWAWSSRIAGALARAEVLELDGD